MTKNEDFRYLCVDLPGDIARRKAAGTYPGRCGWSKPVWRGTANRSWPPACGASAGAAPASPPGLPLSPRPGAGAAAPGVEGHHRRAVRRPGGRRPGRLAVHQWGDAPPRGLCGLLRIYPKEAVGLAPEAEDNTLRNQILARMEAEGVLLPSSPCGPPSAPSRRRRAGRSRPGFPSPLECPQQSGIEFLEMTPAGCAPWGRASADRLVEEPGAGDFSVTYRYCYRADYVSPRPSRPTRSSPTSTPGRRRPTWPSPLICGRWRRGLRRDAGGRWKRRRPSMTM